MNRSLLVGGNPPLSPMMVALTIFGIIFIATLPFVGVPLLLLGLLCQGVRSRERRQGARAARTRALIRRERSAIDSVMSL